MQTSQQWHRGRGGQLLPPKFWAVEKLSEFFSCENFCPKNAKFGLKTSILGTFRGKLKF